MIAELWRNMLMDSLSQCRSVRSALTAARRHSQGNSGENMARSISRNASGTTSILKWECHSRAESGVSLARPLSFPTSFTNLAPIAIGEREVMKDPRMKMDSIPMPFDVKRMLYGGFKVLVDA